MSKKSGRSGASVGDVGASGIAARVSDIVSARRLAAEMGVGIETVVFWINNRLLRVIDIMGETMVTREAIAEFERYARMGYFDRSRFAENREPGFTQSEFAFQEGGFAV